jgi:glycerophosphoryl diester phosphodiesterase
MGWVPRIKHIALCVWGVSMGCSHGSSQLQPATPFRAVAKGPLIIAHRGGSLEAPENTLASVKHAVAVGSDWQEVDVALTSDNIPIVIHDDTLERTTSGVGVVEQLPWSYLKTLQAGSPVWFPHDVARLQKMGVQVPHFGTLFADEKVPSLEQMLQVPDARLMVELKPTLRAQALAQSFSEVLQRTQAFDRVVVGSFSAEVLEAVHRVQPSLPLMAIVDNVDAVEPFWVLPISVVACHVDLAEAVLERVPPGIAVWVWTVYTPETAEKLALMGVHGVITDAPSAVVQALRPAAEQ